MVQNQKFNLMPNWSCRGLVPAARVDIRPTLVAKVVAFVFNVRFAFAGVSQF